MGKLKDTNRYKEANNIFKQAKQKYQPTSTKAFGNSLGGTIAGYNAGRNDKVYTHNKGATIGQKMRSNETHYRTKGDLVSVFNAFSTRTKNLSNPNILKDPYNAHLVNTLKTKKIKV
jgi:predicted alpha/beta-fold hydrolase